ncbi:MAG TPA: M1 family metallopeptidase [Acidobacteriaceae bacterium]|nr:M1 family metallopeptidase [Acidobacteriaceae bacterium]
MNCARLVVLSSALLVASMACAQAAPPSAYHPLETFAPLTLPDPVNVYRSANGAPGPQYWQNRADYELHAAIDTHAKVLTCTELITYTNNSPDTLTSLWLQVEQNIYRKDSRANAAASPAPKTRQAGTQTRSNNEIKTFTEGYSLDSIEIQPLGSAHAATIKAAAVVSDTRLQIQFPENFALHHGEQIHVRIRYHYTIPGLFGGRTSWGKAQQGEIYDIAQWYPRMCVYDDLHGWDTQPYLGNEFYLEYGHFDYYVTVPANMIVAGSGALVNASEVLPAAELSRLAQARASDKTVMVRTAEDVDRAVASSPTQTKTWHFAMDSTRDVVFSASAAFLWDAAKINVPAGAGKPAHTALAQSVYPIESAGADAWGRSTEYLKDAVEHFSARWYPYPYPNAINVAGFSSGMEYPGVLFDGIKDKGKQLFWITAHEIGHTWFPMVVGFNERRNAWMDEGFNTFIDTFESDEFEGGVYGPKRDSEFAPGGGKPADEIVKVLTDPEAPPIMTRADAISETYRHPVTYFKSAFGLVLLREDILGPARFDFAFRKFIREWAFKHPSPSDFFRAMQSEGGEDLSYFWRGWYFHNLQLDLAITSASYVENDPAKGLHVTVENRGQLVLPATLQVELGGGKKIDIAVPAETWMQNTSHRFTIETNGPAESVTIDPDHVVPDVDRSNNSLKIPAD